MLDLGYSVINKAQFQRQYLQQITGQFSSKPANEVTILPVIVAFSRLLPTTT
jgi:hypothetical protein